MAKAEGTRSESTPRDPFLADDRYRRLELGDPRGTPAGPEVSGYRKTETQDSTKKSANG